jgi:3(or 17)beta-hydroxysteroid dehydrogenase
MAGRVAGKVALVTGGAMGLGKADCEILAREGASVIVTDIDEAGAEAVAASVGGIAMRHDVASEDDWLRVYAAITEKYGRLDILVNNAGIVIPENVEQASLATFRKTMAIHAEGTFLGCHYGIPLMAKSGGGSIINMASAAALQGYSPFFAYAGAKGAIRGMSKSIAMHCQEQGYGIRCNTIFPSGIATPMVQSIQADPSQEIPVADGVLPAGAIGAPIDIANMVLFLASDESRFITGAEMVVDNGTMLRPPS